jgi:hypothetical protein
MTFFDLFGKKKQPHEQPDWIGVAAKLSGTLWHLMQTDPKMLAGPYARVVLHDDWNVGIAADKRDPDNLLGTHDVCFAFLQEDRAALAHWVSELKADSNPMFQQIATEEYAKKLVRVLMANTKVVG